MFGLENQFLEKHVKCVKMHVECVKIYVLGVKMYVEGVKMYVECVKFLGVNFLEKLTLTFDLDV